MDHQFPYQWVKNKSSETLKVLIEEEYETIKDKLNRYGAILFKGFDITDMSHFEACVAAFPGKPLDYVDGNSPRTKLQGKIYTSTEYPSEAYISMHNEMSYADQWPKFLFFCCVIPPASGGNTLIADSRKIFQSLPDEIINEFKQKGVTYTRNLHGGMGVGPSWQETFETHEKQDIEAYCKRSNIIFEWKEDDNLRLIQHRTSTLVHEETQEEVWFNQADQFHPSTNSREVFDALMEIHEDDLYGLPHYACFGDGTEIPLETLDKIREVAEQNTVVFPWERGDVMILDNVLSAHGRSPFNGERRILVSMLK